MVDHSDSKRGNPLHWQKVNLYMHNPTDRIVHTTAFVTPILDTRNLSVIIIVMYKNVFRV